MRLGIDASNIRGGGGLTHLKHVLRAANPLAHGFDEVLVWASSATLAALPEQPWLRKCTDAALNSGALRRAFWQHFSLGKIARAHHCDLLFVPGGAVSTDFRPVVTMSRNALPFEWRELWRYRWSLTGLRLLLLRWIQIRSFRSASGVIFLTNYAREIVTKTTGPLPGDSHIIPHGIDARFFREAGVSPVTAEQRSTLDHKIIYVSIIDLYKHQWHVAEAAAILRAQHQVTVSFIGPANPVALARLKRVTALRDAEGIFLQLLGEMPHEELPAHYASADICVFASSCENMPNTLLEGMAAGLAIACSNRGPMPEVLGDAGVYFDPESPPSIAAALRQLLESSALREQKAKAALARARQYSWARCAEETFEFLARVAMRSSGASRPIAYVDRQAASL